MGRTHSDASAFKSKAWGNEWVWMLKQRRSWQAFLLPCPLGCCPSSWSFSRYSEVFKRTYTHSQSPSQGRCQYSFSFFFFLFLALVKKLPAALTNASLWCFKSRKFFFLFPATRSFYLCLSFFFFSQSQHWGSRDVWKCLFLSIAQSFR